MIVSNLKRFKEDNVDEIVGIYEGLATIDSICELNTEAVDILVEETPLVYWLIKRIERKLFNEVKFYASEVLAVIIQSSTKAQEKLASFNGIEILLIAINNPSNIKEEEYLGNIYNILCVAAITPVNREAFIKHQGFHLLRRIIKKMRYGRKYALKLLDYMLEGDEVCCKTWLEVRGLATLFSAFLGKGSEKHAKGFDPKDIEYILSSIASLLKCFRDSEAELIRVVNKFREQNYAKLTHLVACYKLYESKYAVAEQKINYEKQLLAQKNIEIDEDLEEEFLLLRFDAGMFTLQKIAYILAVLSDYDTKTLSRIKQLFEANNMTYANIKIILENYKGTLGDANSPEKTKKEQEYLDKLIALF